MKRKPIICALSFLLVVIACLGTYRLWLYFDDPQTLEFQLKGMNDISDLQFESLEARAAAAKEYATSHHMSTNYALFVDYSVPSGKTRLYVWDFAKNKVVARTYVMHGSGRGKSTAEKPAFSNRHGSYCSSLGRFLVTREHGRINRNGFRLKGLDRTNSNAYGRGLMIHSSSYLDWNIGRKFIPLNDRSCQGCVTVTSRGLSYISRLVNSETKPLLLWNYCSKEVK